MDLVGENSPNLRPTISSIIFNLTNRLPLCTYNKIPIKMGNITELLLKIFKSFLDEIFCFRIFFKFKDSAKKGPFHFDLLILKNTIFLLLDAN